MNSFPFIIYNINMKTLYKSLLVLTILTLIFRTLTFFQYSLFISIALLLVVHWIPHILYKTEYVAYIYFLPYCKKAYVTKVDYRYEADVFFPNLDEDDDWVMTHDSDEQTYYDLEYYFTIYQRKDSLPNHSL